MKKILLIEDEKALQKTLRERLEDMGYEVISALDGGTALFLAEENKPNLILLDIMLPIKNGFEVLKELKSSDSTKEIPVIILTNLDSAEEIERALKLGATTYLVKANYHLDDIIDKIEKAIQ